MTTINQKRDRYGFPVWNVKRLFTGGVLNGLTHTGETSVSFKVGFECPNPCGGSPYRIVSVEPVPAE